MMQMRDLLVVDEFLIKSTLEPSLCTFPLLLLNQLPDSFRQLDKSCLNSPPHSLVNPSLSSSPLSIHHSFILSLQAQNLSFQQILFTLTFPLTHWTAFMIMGLDWTYHAHQFIVCFSFYIFLFVPCGRLSWLSVSFLLHVKYTVSYRIPSPRDVSVTPDCVPYVYALVRQCALASCVTHTLRFIKLS